MNENEEEVIEEGGVISTLTSQTREEAADAHPTSSSAGKRKLPNDVVLEKKILIIYRTKSQKK